MVATNAKGTTPPGLFIAHMTDHIFGHVWRSVVSSTHAADDPCRRWVHEQLLDPRVVTSIRHEFPDDPQVPHVCLSDALRPGRAAQIYAALETATFVEHHHALYPLEIAPRAQQTHSVLAQFMDWLATREAAAFHSWLVRWPHPLPQPLAIQVQTSRMREGHHFPIHMDTDQEGIAVVYNMTPEWDPSWGGVLQFPDPSTGTGGLVIPPVFNSMLLFRPAGAPHLVSPIQPRAQGQYRYTITAFYLSAI